MHSLEGNFTGNNTTSEIILFEVPSNRHSSTGGVEVVDRKCPQAKAVWEGVTNFIQPYLHQFSINSHCLNGYGKPLKRPFDRYQSRLKAINNG